MDPILLGRTSSRTAARVFDTENGHGLLAEADTKHWNLSVAKNLGGDPISDARCRRPEPGEITMLSNSRA